MGLSKKSIWRIVGVGSLLLVLGLAACIPLASRPLPKAATGPEMDEQADQLALLMERAVNKRAWDQTAYVRWNFLGQHTHLWDRFNRQARVSWGDYTVYLNTQTGAGSAWKKGEKLEGSERQKALAKALDYFYNDSFWLNAPVKAFDEGVKREVVFQKDGSAGLLLSYQSGGVTPGDTYLWTLSPTGQPLRWNMWVQVLPIKGLGNTWEGWDTLYTGARISKAHAAGPFKINMIRDLASGRKLSDLGEPENALNPAFFEVSEAEDPGGSGGSRASEASGTEGAGASGK